MKRLGTVLVIGSGILISLAFLQVEAAGIAASLINLINPMFHLRVLVKCVTMPLVWLGAAGFVAGLWMLQSSSEPQ